MRELIRQAFRLLKEDEHALTAVTLISVWILMFVEIGKLVFYYWMHNK